MSNDLKGNLPSVPVPPSSRSPASGLRSAQSGDNIPSPHPMLIAAERRLRELKKELETNADELERATIEALRLQGDLGAMKKELEATQAREAAAAHESVALAAELGEMRTLLEHRTNVMRRVLERAESLERARDAGTSIDSELHEILTLLELHLPDKDAR